MGFLSKLGDAITKPLDVAKDLLDVGVDTTKEVVNQSIDSTRALVSGDVGEFARQNFNHIANIAQSGKSVGNAVAGSMQSTTELVGSTPVVGNLLQAGIAMTPGLGTIVNGDFNPKHILRNTINAPSTSIGVGLAIAGGGDIKYDRENGIWYATDTAKWTHMSGGTAYGSMFVTNKTEHQVRCDGNGRLLNHEENHADQYALFGGGLGLPSAYIAEGARSGFEENNYFERQAGLVDGGYARPSEPNPSHDEKDCPYNRA